MAVLGTGFWEKFVSAKATPHLTEKNAEQNYELEAQIGFVLRRAHQRHVAIFADCLADLSLTPQQFSALAKVREEGAV
ncbi:MAG: hypothetical protein ABWY00_18110, partial [Dongiaceae bacterium]